MKAQPCSRHAVGPRVLSAVAAYDVASKIYPALHGGPAFAGVYPLPAQPLSGGHGYIQAPAAGEPRALGAERVCRAVLLQAGLLRRELGNLGRAVQIEPRLNPGSSQVEPRLTPG